jgi:hypothetical protein
MLGVHDEDTTMLSDLLPAIRRFTYLYDFGDSWEHIIKVGKIGYVDGGPYVECTSGRGMTLPEDCGGPHGYKRLRAIIKDPSHAEYDEWKVWAEYDFDNGFDLDSTNEELRELEFEDQA